MERPSEALWASILGIEARVIRLDNNFLRVRGDSIKAMMMARRVSDKFNMRISIDQSLQQTRLSALAMEIARLQAGFPDLDVDLDAQMQDIKHFHGEVDISAYLELTTAL